MNVNEISVSSAVGELVKNSIDAQSTVIQVEFNGSFDIRVIDDGCGFGESILQDIGERQLFLPDTLENRFRYGKNGKFLHTIAQITSEIYIETIKRDTDVRLYKNIIFNKSVFKIYETERNYGEAVVQTPQGSMVVLNTLNVSIGNTAQQKSNIVNSVTELALINYEINISVKDTATQQTLYETYRTKNLFHKFEQFLERNQFFSKIQSVSCQKHDVKVELFLCEDGTSGKAFQFVYFNKLSEHDGKWTKFINKLCKRRFENDLNSKSPVYLVNICAENYLSNELANNVIIDNCIRKCMEELFKSCVTKETTSKNNHSKHDSPTHNEAGHEEKGNKTKLHGVRLGDWIFNNSCENYEKINHGKEMYRKKVCENWVISLEKPKPKNANDSLNSVVNKSNVQQGDHIFKKPQPRKNRKSSTRHKSKMKPLPHVSTQVYKPSQQVKAFDNSGLIRASKKLILKASQKEKNPAKNSIDNLEVNLPKTLEHDSKRHNKRTLENVDRLPTDPLYTVDTVQNDDILENPIGIKGPNDKTNKPSKSQIRDIKDKPNSNLKLETRNALDFEMHETNQSINFSMNFSSSIPIHTINDPFVGFLENDPNEINSIGNLFESNFPSTSCISYETQQSQLNRRGGSSVYSERSELQYRNHRNDSIHTHYRQRTYIRNSRSRSSSSSRSTSRPKSSRSIRSSSNSGTAVAPIRQQSSLGNLNDEVRQTGWPVTININFGQPK